MTISIGAVLRKTFVPVIDWTALLRGPLGEAGGVLRLRSFEEKSIQYYLSKLGPAERYRLTRTEMAELMQKLDSSNVTEILNAYLGRWWSADFAEIWRSPPQARPGEWHHDNVGHRIKVFIILANDSDENGTEIVPFSHVSRWGDFNSRLSPPTGQPVFIPQPPGTVFMFDTNAIHRGMYSATERIVMQIEFSNMLKSVLVPGQVGRFFRGRFDNSYRKGIAGAST